MHPIPLFPQSCLQEQQADASNASPATTVSSSTISSAVAGAPQPSSAANNTASLKNLQTEPNAPTSNNNNTATATTTSTTNGGGGSVIGGITTWMPSSTNVTTNRSELDINSTPPQSIAIVAGRKYIMVPKTNLMSVSPSGDVKIGDNNGMPLQYVGQPSPRQPSSSNK